MSLSAEQLCACFNDKNSIIVKRNGKEHVRNYSRTLKNGKGLNAGDLMERNLAMQSELLRRIMER